MNSSPLILHAKQSSGELDQMLTKKPIHFYYSKVQKLSIAFSNSIPV
jgi:hypothetical protein